MVVADRVSEEFLLLFFSLLFNAFSVFLFEVSAHEANSTVLIFTLNSDKAILAFAVLHARGDLPERDERGVKAIVEAILVAAENLGGMLSKELSEFLVEASSLGEVVVEGRLHELHVLSSLVLEVFVNNIHVFGDVIHTGADQFRVELFDVELAAAAA